MRIRENINVSLIPKISGTLETRVNYGVLSGKVLEKLRLISRK